MALNTTPYNSTIEITPGFAVGIDRLPLIKQAKDPALDTRMEKELTRFRRQNTTHVRAYVETMLTVSADGNHFLKTHDERFVFAARVQNGRMVIEACAGSPGLNMDASAAYANERARESLAEQYVRYAVAKANLTSQAFNDLTCCEAALQSTAQNQNRDDWEKAARRDPSQATKPKIHPRLG